MTDKRSPRHTNYPRCGLRGGRCELCGIRISVKSGVPKRCNDAEGCKRRQEAKQG